MINIDGSTSVVFDVAPPPAFHMATGAPAAARALLEDFGRNIGLPSLHFGEDNGCWLQIDTQHIVCISTQGEDEGIRIHGEVSQLLTERDAPDLAPYFRRLLELNMEAASSGETLSFAVDPRRNALTLVANLPMTATQQQLQDVLKQLLAQIEILQANPPAADDLSSDRKTMASSRGMAREYKLMTEPPPLSDELLFRV